MTLYRLMSIRETQVPTQLEVTVVGCYNLENRGPDGTEYSCVLLEYDGSTRMTTPCLGGGKHPVFQEKLVFAFTEGVRELNIAVWTNQPLGKDGIIGFLSLQLQQVLSDGYVDSTWILQGKDGRPAGEIRLMLEFSNSTFQRLDSRYTVPTLDSTAPLEPDAIQPAILSQLLPYGSLPPMPVVPRLNAPYPCMAYPPNSAPPPESVYPPTQPNAAGPALWSQLLPYASSTPPAAPAYDVPFSPDPALTSTHVYPPPQPMSFCPSTSPPAGYPSQSHRHYLPTPPGPASAIYPPPPR